VLVAAATFTVTWSPAIWSVVSALMVFLVLLSRQWLVNQQRKARNERPPQTTKLLRPAGHTCFCRMDEAFEKLMSALVQMAGAGAIFGLSLGGVAPIIQGLVLRRFSLAQLWAVPKSSMLAVMLVVAVSALAWCVAMALSVFRYLDDVRNWRMGGRGEQAVAEKLADPKLAAAGYRVFHDVPGDGCWNIDHVAVGPGGVFVIETKARVRRKSKTAQAEHEVSYDGRVLRFPWCDDNKAVGQVEANAEWLGKKLAPYAPKGLLLQPVIVVPGWYVKSLGNFKTKAMNDKYLVEYLASAQRLFTLEQLRVFTSRLDELCRTLEF
jgi:Nuclease-related domain